MQINLPDEVAPLVQQKATAAGFAGQIDAYVAHLIATDEVEDYGAPANLSVAGKSREEIDAMITVGIESGPATPMAADDWRTLHARLEQFSKPHC
jgi:hypothetical protein